jgi:hypothetical protein
MQKQVETLASFEDLESSKGIIEIRFQADNCSFLNKKASISYQMRLKVETETQPFLDGQEISTQKTFELEGEAFEDFWEDTETELYQLALESLGVTPTKVVKTVTTSDYQNPQNNSTVSVEL